MNLAISTEDGYLHGMEGVTTALVLFIFACVLFPHVIRNKSQYYFAVGCVMALILLSTIRLMTGPEGAAYKFLAVASGVLQLLAFLSLMLGTSGQSAAELGGEMARAYEVIRRGEEDREIIIPIKGAKARPSPAQDEEEDRPPRINLDEELQDLQPPAPVAPPPQRTEDRSPIPLE